MTHDSVTYSSGFRSMVVRDMKTFPVRGTNNIVGSHDQWILECCVMYHLVTAHYGLKHLN